MTDQGEKRIPDAFFREYLSLLLKGDRRKCTRMVKELLDGDIPLKVLYTDLFQRAMYNVGELWEQNRISVAVEHLATSVTEGLLNMVYPVLFRKPHIGKKAVISCTVNEYHQLGGRMVADLFELNGWDGYFLGANTPVSDLLEFVGEKKPDVVGLSVSLYFNMGELRKVIEELRGAYPRQDIMVGGQAFRWGGREIATDFPNIMLVPSLGALESLIRQG